MKKLLIAMGVLGVLLVVLVFVLLGNLDKIVKGSIEGVGTELLGTPVGVDAVAIELKNGGGTISGLSIANPTGFSAGNAFQMDKIKLGIDLGSIGKQPLVINELEIDSPIVRLDVNEDGSSNLNTLMDNMKNNSTKADEKAAEQQGEPMRMSFERLSITGVTVQVNIAGQPSETVVIPDIEKHNLGKDGGLTPAQLGTIIIGDIISSSLEHALEKKITEKIGEATESFIGNLKKKLSHD